MPPQHTRELLDDPRWVPFTHSLEVECQGLPEAIVRLGADGRDYLALRVPSESYNHQWIYLPLEPDGAGFPKPELSESLTGKRPLPSVIGNADEVYVVDQDPNTRAFVRTVRTTIHNMPEDDPIMANLPPDTARLQASPDTLKEWKTRTGR